MDEKPIDTGLVTAAVNPPAVQLPVPAPAAQMPAGWTIQKVAALTRDLATNMYDVPYIIKTHGLTQAQYEILQANDLFQRTLQTMTVEWNRIDNTQRRLALESAILLEDALPTVGARLSKATEPIAGVVELAKLLGKFAGIGETTQTNAPTEKFKIVINLGADTFSAEKQRGPIQIITVGEEGTSQGGREALPAVTEGAS